MLIRWYVEHPPSKQSKRRQKRPTPKLPYSAQERLITPAELRFLHTALQPALGKRFYIGVQVPMTAVLKVPDDQWDKTAGRKIRQKKLDFVLANRQTFEIVAVIELDDRSHELEHRKRRDRFVDQAFAAAGVLLIRIPVYRRYDPRLIRTIINTQLRRHRRDKRAVHSRLGSH